MFCTEDNATSTWRPATQEERSRGYAIIAEKEKAVVNVRGTFRSRVRYMFSLLPAAFLWCWRNFVGKK